MADDLFTYEYEEWRDIPGWEGYYQASSLGKIRSVERTLTRNIPSKPTRFMDFRYGGKILKQITCPRTGYKKIGLRSPSAGEKLARVHRLVCLAFHGIAPPDRSEAAHNDGIRDNNRASNLRWASRQENVADIAKHRASREPINV